MYIYYIIELIIQDSPNIILTRNVTAVTGSNLTIPCQVKGYPWVDLAWRRFNSTDDLTNVNRPNKIRLDLVFNYIHRKDDGIYICYAKNNESVNAQFELIVKGT